MDDATSAIYSALLTEEEGARSSFQGLARVIAEHGLFCAPYTDWASHYFHTPKAGERVDKEHPTQVGRALRQLGIERTSRPTHQKRAAAPSGRSAPSRTACPRSWRWPASPRPRPPAGSSATFTCPSTTPRSPWHPSSRARPSSPTMVGRAHGEILRIQEDHVVGNDNTARYRGLHLQIPPSPLRPHFVKARVRVHEYPDATPAVFHGPRCLARYRADGTPVDRAHGLAA